MTEHATVMCYKCIADDSNTDFSCFFTPAICQIAAVFVSAYSSSSG